MSALTSLDLSSNSFTGTIASAIGTATNLVSLDLEQNLLRGTIPSTIGSLGSVTIIQLSNNAFSGTIPSTIVSLTKLKWLYLYQNSLTGTIPDNIGGIGTQFVELGLLYNQLTGTIPSTFNQLKLDNFNFYSNYLTMGSLSTVPWSTFSDYTLARLNVNGLGGNCLAFTKGASVIRATRCKPTAGKLII